MPTDQRIPVTVLTGFLGSGKTTLLNRILTDRHGLRIAVIENEFGEVGVDDALVLDAEEEVFEMNNGCICCTVRGDLIRILGALLRRKDRFDAILVETTGLADPAPVAQTFFVDDTLRAQLRLDAIVTVVDAKHVLAHLDEVKPDGVENEAVEQIAFADRIVLNKTDLVGPGEIAEVTGRIRAVNASAAVLPAVRADVDLRQILDVRAFDLDTVLADEPDFLDPDAEHQHDQSVTSVGIEADGAVDVPRLNDWLGTLLGRRGPDLFRSKGVLNLAGDDRRYVFQGVHMLHDGELGAPWRETESRRNRMVFIGRNLDRAELEAGFRACLVGAGA
ncbi:CobW family GTP-binding protein [Pseudonocardia acidicola]|uniref:GTP-binding protein n=1 Tax=Pseudonocardia acidicola TaxID=2724939 RepID=A0ABX1SD83_9PSEU|nr:GTP-binding protein [Pseudonocardia acidicola]NMH98822.1 GTP-binding protein [Pseudonocardia acidicola]